MIETLYPWLVPYWQQIQQLRSRERLPHAILAVAPNGLGLDGLVRALAQLMLCRTPAESGFACGQCHDCTMFQAHSHPDYHFLTLPDKKSVIPVEQVRELIDVLNERAYQGGYRVALIEPAEKMNRNAANALLKTLEEPGDDTLLILSSGTLKGLPPTIVSRCRLMTVAAPSETTALDYVREHYPDNETTDRLAVRLCNNRPLAALELLKSGQLRRRQDFLAYLEGLKAGRLEVTSLSAKAKKLEWQENCHWLMNLLLDAEKLNAGIPLEVLTNHDHSALLKELAAISVEKRFQWQKQLVEQQQLLSSDTSFNLRLIVEDILLGWIAIFK